MNKLDKHQLQQVKDSKVYVESSAVTVSGLSNAGNSTVVLPNASKLGIAEVDGTLHLSQREYYNSPYGEDNTANYSDSYAQTLSGDISGSGTICLDSGIYIIPAGTTLSSVSFSTDAGGLLYDYASLLTGTRGRFRLWRQGFTKFTIGMVLKL